MPLAAHHEPTFARVIQTRVMALGVGFRLWLASGALVGLAFACSSGKNRDFAEASESTGGAGAGTAPSAAGGAPSDAGGAPAEVKEPGGAGMPNAGSTNAAAGESGVGGCSTSACDSPDPGVDDCSPNPCKNGGVCSDVGDGFSCECTDGFAGAECREKALEGLPLLPSAASCNVNALNGNGRVAVGDCQVNGLRTAFWWKPSIGTKALSTGEESSATALTSDGTFVVGYARSSPGDARGVSWLNGAGSTGYSGLSYAGMAVTCNATAVSDDGKLVAGGSESSNGSPRGVRWVDHVVELLGSGHGEIYAKAMSGDGKVIVGYGYDPDAALKWTPETGLVDLPLPDGEDRGQAFGVSHDGTVIVGNSGSQALRWVSGGAPEALGIVGIARAASESGDVIVGNSGGEAMVWDKARGARILSDVLFELGADLTGWTLSEAVAVSADGRVVAGNGSRAGVEQAWLARLP